MALSPYEKPTTPHDPNGIAHYVAKINRATVKALWDTWVNTTWKGANNSPAPLTIANCNTIWTSVKLASNTNGSKTISLYTFTSAGATFVTAGVAAGDILVISSGTEQGSYIIASVDSETQLTITLTNGWASTEGTLTYSIHNNHTVGVSLQRGDNASADNKSVAISVRTAFTTGLVAYFPTGTLNLSTYRRIKFKIRQTTGTTMVANDLSIKLCSDVYGVTAVNTFNIPVLSTVPNAWTEVELDNGAALGASIASVAFYVNIDRGEQTFLIDDFVVLEPLPAAFDYAGLYTNGAP